MQSNPSLESDASNADKSQKNLGILFELFKFIQPYRLKVFAALVALVATASLTLTVGHGVRILIDQGFAQQSTAELGSAIGFILVITLLIFYRYIFSFLLGVVSW